MKILFTPVGYSDPISRNRDGSMLSICRKEKPNKVYLYLSKDMVELEEKDHRFTGSIDLLSQKINHKMDIELIRRADLDQAHEFDVYYPEFLEQIQRIFKENTIEGNPPEVLVNVSSGTPGMKSALQFLAAMNSKGPQQIVPYQVKDPNEGKKEYKAFDVKREFDANLDNDTALNKTRESVSKYDNQVDLVKMEVIRNLIARYEYSAARDVAKTLTNELEPEAMTYLEGAKWRMLYDLEKVEKTLGIYECKKFFPFSDPDKRGICEYILNLQIKQEKQEYPDFFRAISLIVLPLLELTIENFCKIDIRTFYKEENSILCWDRDKIMTDELLEKIVIVGNNQKQGFITNSTLMSIINEYKKVNKPLCEDQCKAFALAKQLRETEQSLRNTFAHNLVIISTNYEQEAKEFLENTRELANLNQIDMSDEVYKSYESMNQSLLEKLKIKRTTLSIPVV